MNPNTQTREFSLRDPDGYYVTISALSAPQRRGPARRPNKQTVVCAGHRGDKNRLTGQHSERGQPYREQ